MQPETAEEKTQVRFGHLMMTMMTARGLLRICGLQNYRMTSTRVRCTAQTVIHSS